MGGLGGLVCVVGGLETEGEDGGREVRTGETVEGLAMVVVFWGVM